MKRQTLFAVVVSILLALVTVGSLSACAPSASAPAAATGPIKIGLELAQQGPFTALGVGVMKGFQLGIKEAGAKVAGRNIEVIVEDEGMDPGFSLDKARKLVEQDKVSIMVGGVSSTTATAIATYCAQRKIPNFCAVLAATAMVKLPYYYAPIATVYSQPRALGWYAFDEKGIKTVTTISNEWTAGHDFIEGFEYGFATERKGTVVQKQFLAFGTQDYSSYIVAMKDADAAVVMLLPPDIAPFIVQAKQMGVTEKKKLLLLGSTVLPPMLPDLGPMLIGKSWSIPEYQEFYPGSVNKRFLEAFQAEYKAPADNFNANGYTRALMVMEALKKTNGDTDPDKFHEAMKSMSIETPQGPIKFTQGNPDKSNVQGIVTEFIEEVQQVNGRYVWNLIKQYPDVKPVNRP
jgi:branched-chain amino acid transport system substrate-binding protein